MPLTAATQKLVLNYCDRDLPNPKWFADYFNFIDSEPLKQRLASEFYSARYVYKLGEGLAVGGERLQAHVKFQIVQYASIYEAIIIHLLWSKFAGHDAVVGMEYHDTYKLEHSAT